MQNIIQHTRNKLMPFLGGSAKEVQSELNFGNSGTMPVSYTSRFGKRIPKRNYDQIGKFVPISWL